MIFISDALGNNVSVDTDMVPNGHPGLSALVSVEISLLAVYGASPLLALYYQLLEKGFNVSADPETLNTDEVPEGATT